jgi:hypothetical protein
MVKHPNCTQCDCGSFIDPNYPQHQRQSPPGSVPAIGAPTALAALGSPEKAMQELATQAQALDMGYGTAENGNGDST